MGQVKDARPGGYRTMVDIAFGYVRDAILSGDFPSGSRIPQDLVAAGLKISRMPLREALRQLEVRGFITMEPYRGAVVTTVSTDAVKEIYFIRIALESQSAGLAAKCMDRARIRTLKRLVAKARDALEDGDLVVLAEANRDFHLVGHMANNLPILNRIIQELSDHSHRYRLLHSSLGMRPHAALAEHELILEAWAAGDSEAAAHWMNLNLVKSRDALIGSLAAGEAGDAVPYAAEGQS